MKGVFWFLGLAAAAAALALLVGQNQAGVTLFWHPYRIDLSFNLVLFGALLLFVLLHAGLRGVAMLRALPQRAQRWRLQQLERGVNGAVLDALAYQLAGRFVRAQASAQHALDQLASLDRHAFPRRDQVQVLAHLLAAESAHALRNAARRDVGLRAAIEGESARHAPEAREGALLRAADWALDDRDAAQAAMWLAALPQGAARRIGALRLRLKLARLQQDTAGALDMVRLLTKHRAFSAEVSQSLLRGLVLDALRATHDPAQLLRVWSGLEASERAAPELALAALEQWDTLQAQGPSEAPDPASAAFVLGCLKTAWQHQAELAPEPRTRLFLRMEAALPGMGTEWLAQIEQMQQRHPADAGLQYLAGQVFLQRQLWGKAAVLLGQASTQLKDRELLRRAWCGLARLAEERGDTAAAEKAWKQAALA